MEGSWETASWFLGRLNNAYFPDDYGFASVTFSTWIINVIGDYNLCPSSYLRIELINLFLVMVDITSHNWNQALVSVMSACSSLNMDYLTGGSLTGFYNIDLNTITYTLEMLSTEWKGYMIEFDERLAEKLESDIKSRVTIMLHDFACNHSSYPSRHTEPMEVYSLIAIAKTIGACIRLESKRFESDGLYQGQWTILKDYSHNVKVLFETFKMSLQMPQLQEVAASCVMDLVELVLMVNAKMIIERDEIYMQCMINTDELLEELIDSSVIITFFVDIMMDVLLI